MSTANTTRVSKLIEGRSPEELREVSQFLAELVIEIVKTRIPNAEIDLTNEPIYSSYEKLVCGQRHSIIDLMQYESSELGDVDFWVWYYERLFEAVATFLCDRLRNKFIPRGQPLNWGFRYRERFDEPSYTIEMIVEFFISPNLTKEEIR